MADNARGRVSASILPDNIKSKFTGNLDFTISTTIAASSGQGWIYAEKEVGTSGSADLIEVTDDYLSSDFDGIVAVGDKVLWLCIQHTGTTNGTTTTDEGIMLCFDADTVVYTLADGIFIDSGETMILKAPNTTIANLHARTCAVSNGLPSADGSGNARVKIAAILQNVG